jgi:hypothetical protein
VIDAATRTLIRERAANRCEYCHLPEALASFAQFHVEHIVASQHDRSDDPQNLAFACHHCNLHKGPNLASVDPRTRKRTWLFNPRRHKWSRHFRWNGPFLLGRTPTGRATVHALASNHPDAVKDRIELLAEGVFELE